MSPLLAPEKKEHHKDKSLFFTISQYLNLNPVILDPSLASSKDSVGDASSSKEYQFLSECLKDSKPEEVFDEWR
jgi:hypothetical protein